MPSGPNGRHSKRQIWNRVEFGERSPSDRERGPQPPPSLRAQLRRLGFRPRKKLGQNFLADEGILDRIVESAELAPSDEILEVGPGLGTLTARLADRAGHVVAVEIDPELAKVVAEELRARGNVDVVNQDILRFDLCSRFRPHAYKMVGNLPYYVTSPILRHFLESKCQPSLMVVMLQREVAERITARPGEMSLLAVSVQLYGEPRLVRLVDAGAFYPPPKVDSAIVRIDLYPRPAVDVEPEAFFALVAAGFAQRRKMLHNALAQRFWMPAGRAPALLQAAGIDPKRRAETLSLAEWAALYGVFVREGILKPKPAGKEEPPSA